ncbi:MAG: aspartate aminotransferase family protein, partial [Acidobacteriaceae bacterium]
AMTMNRIGSMFTWFFSDCAVTDWASAETCDTAAFGRFHRAMLQAGVWLPPSQFEAAFVSAAHGEREVERTLQVLRAAFANGARS